MHAMPSSLTRTGGCHCRAVRFEADLPSPTPELLDCDCSICAMSGFLHLILPAAAFRLLTPEAS